jgi:drug/metabolite transporter (DMT)-like permease
MTAAAASAREAPFQPYDALLYALTVFAWSASWYALAVQAASGVAPPVSVAWRFVLASAVMFAWAGLRRQGPRFPPAEHLRFAALGLLIFSLNFTLFYYASLTIVSGLLAVVFSLASIVNMGLNAALERRPPPARRLAGAALGAGGVALLYAPSLKAGAASATGLALCLGGVLSFCLGNLVSARLQARGAPFLASNAWGMAYGAAWAALGAALMGERFALPLDAAYLGSLLWLALVSTVLAFWAYLTLVGRIGSGRAAYATVMFPIFALLISTAVEGYAWSPAAALGVGMALAGNLFVLRR